MHKLLVLLSTVLAFACGAPSTDDAGTTDPDLTCASSPGAATLATNVQPLLAASCASSSCHAANFSYGDYSTEARSALMVNKKSLYAGTAATLKVVDSTSLANSSLWLKVLGGAAKGRTGPKSENVSGVMPNDNTTLTAAQKQILKDWICTGAK